MCTYKAIAEPRQSTIFETHSGVCDNAESALQSALRRQYHDWDIVATLTSNGEQIRPSAYIAKTLSQSTFSGLLELATRVQS